MAQQIIDTGAAANDGTGEPLRQAFTDVNDNFTQIWTAGPVGSNVQISNNVISTTGLNENLIIEANGIGTVNFESTVIPGVDSVYDLGSTTNKFDTIYGQYFVGNGSLLTGISADSGSYIVNGTSNVAIPQLNGNVTVTVAGVSNVAVVNRFGITVTGNVTPGTNALYNLGSPTQQWNDVYTGAVYSAGAVSATGAITGGSTLSVAGNITSAANISGSNFIGNGRGLTGILATNGGNLTYASTPPTENVLAGDIWIQSTTGIQYIYFYDGLSNVWAEMEAYQSFSAGSSGGTTDLTAVSSNIIPTSNAVYSIGSSTLQWKDLYLSGSSLYIGGQTIATSGTTLTFNGANVAVQGASPSFNFVTATGNVVGGNVNTTGKVSASGSITAVGNIQGNYFIGNGSLLTGISGGGGSYPADATFNTVTANTVYTANLEFTGTGPVVIGSGNDINLNTVGQVTFSNIVSLPSFTKAELANVAGAITGSIAYCSNASGGACPVWFNGSSWLKISDNGAI